MPKNSFSAYPRGAHADAIDHALAALVENFCDEPEIFAYRKDGPLQANGPCATLT